jgi:hypothetical protein
LFRLKQDIHFKANIKSIMLLLILCVPNLAQSRLVVGVDVNNGFERVTGLQDTGQSYYLLSKELTELGFSLAYNSGRTTTYVEHKVKTVKYESGDSVNLNETDFLENTETKLGFSTGKFTLFKLAIGQANQTFITNVDGFDLNIEVLQTSFAEFGFRANLYSSSSMSLGLDANYRHYFGGTKSDNYDFQLEYGRSFGGVLSLDIGKWNAKGMVFRTYLGYDHEQFYENTNSQTRTNIDFGVKLYINF